MEEPLDLFDALIEEDYITRTETGFLQDMLCIVGLPQLSKKLQTFHKSQSLSQGTLTEKTERLIEFLKHIYKGHFALLQPIPWYDDLKLKLTEVYTRLEVKQVERGNTKVGQDLKNLHDMFMADEEGQHAQRIRIEGPPAMGKSTLCRKIAYDWACGELKQYKLLFFLEMRHVTGSKVIDEIFSQLLPKDLSITKDELANIISRQEKSTLFLFDGLDEIAKDKIEDCEIADHIAKKLRVYCTIVITTRPRLRDRCLSICDLYLIVKGFTKKSTNEYIDKYFKDDKDASMALKQKIKLQREDITSDSITDLLRNPLHVSFLCILWEDYKLSKKENYFPKNHTELYSEVLECTLKRYCTKKGIELNNGEIPK
ncbi:NACHT, LRR and PYD domains-containing protein 6-like [Ptychodera flava]|uniref:NACHT, LRR and PYD domains-containing protein 6-like n=1 Tax=Ptychodera flava TaxID=63121 RepID=UPI00396A14BB